jgi:hypothetical protein
MQTSWRSERHDIEMSLQGASCGSAWRLVRRRRRPSRDASATWSTGNANEIAEALLSACVTLMPRVQEPREPHAGAGLARRPGAPADDRAGSSGSSPGRWSRAMQSTAASTPAPCGEPGPLGEPVVCRPTCPSCPKKVIGLRQDHARLRAVEGVESELAASSTNPVDIGGFNISQ